MLFKFSTKPSSDDEQGEAQSSDQQDPSSSSSSSEQYNVFRDSPVRYLGYANEVGESFRYQFPQYVGPSYMLAFGYVFMDSAYAGYKMWNAKDDDPVSTTTTGGGRSKEVKTAIATVDSLIWQTLASVMIPGAAINMIVKSSRLVLSRATFLPTIAAGWGPTGIGLASIPFIIHPIDNAVDQLMDNTVREWLKEEGESGGSSGSSGREEYVKK